MTRVITGRGGAVLQAILKHIKINYTLLAAISIGDPVIASGDGTALLLYVGIAAGIAASLIMWRHLRRKSKE